MTLSKPERKNLCFALRLAIMMEQTSADSFCTAFRKGKNAYRMPLIASPENLVHVNRCKRNIKTFRKLLQKITPDPKP